MVRKVLGLMILLFGVITLVACDNSRDEDTFRYVSIKVYDPVYIGYKKGFFEEEGVNLEFLSTIAGGPSAVHMVSSGNADGSLSSLMAMNNAVNSNENILGIADIQSSTEFEPLERFFMHKDKLPSGWDDFSEKEKAEFLFKQKISVNMVGSSFYYTWKFYFEKYDLDFDDLVLAPLSFADQVTAIRNGAVDVVSLMTPFNMQLIEDENYVQVLDALDVFGEKQFSLIFVNSDLAERNPDLITRFMNALLKTYDWIKENQNEAKDIISEYTGVDSKYIIDYYFQKDMMIVEDDVRFWLDYMGYNDIPNEKIATNKFNERVGK